MINERTPSTAHVVDQAERDLEAAVKDSTQPRMSVEEALLCSIAQSSLAVAKYCEGMLQRLPTPKYLVDPDTLVAGEKATASEIRQLHEVRDPRVDDPDLETVQRLDELLHDGVQRTPLETLERIKALLAG